ncbi:two-component response regulator [Glycocaulis alkaliphilus]|uniref:Two-component response regulator n=1 Tax=Glycocaulis alkaliphilus TaxID=1434191 RepID=A0A3T0E8F0_9PROT|nr:response regulator [Glycocaulis alkaliphilus]AZU03589.1 two-component response regulator [Glycocaulis alkaliphilus]GGB74704.1 response regulator [Glycocaulis alkaliphilus]
MKIDEISAHLPYLRRYARALAGDQQRGDALVQGALQKAVSGEIAFDGQLAPRIALFRAFHDATAEAGMIAAEPQRGPDSRLQRLEAKSRQALLLTAMEGFSAQEAGQVLALPESQVDDLVARAHGDIELALKTRVLIIEDEPVIAADIEAIVGDLGHEVCAIATTRSEAIAEASRHQPGLVLADIQLADNSSGIDAANDILADLAVPIIFITAYPERLLTGERPEPAFLITKPFLPNAVKAAISQALFFEEDAQPAPRRAQA